MRIGGEYRPEYVEPRHLDRLLEEAGLGAAAARRRLRGHGRRAAPEAARKVRARARCPGLGCARSSTRIVEIVDRRAAQLAALAAPVVR